MACCTHAGRMIHERLGHKHKAVYLTLLCSSTLLHSHRLHDYYQDTVSCHFLHVSPSHCAVVTVWDIVFLPCCSACDSAACSQGPNNVVTPELERPKPFQLKHRGRCPHKSCITAESRLKQWPSLFVLALSLLQLDM